MTLDLKMAITEHVDVVSIDATENNVESLPFDENTALKNGEVNGELRRVFTR